MKLPDHLSASSINTFIGCPFKKFCAYNKRPIIYTDRKSADFGVAVHQIIPSYYDLISDFPTKPSMMEAIDIAFSEGSNYATTSRKTKFGRVKKHFIAIEEKRINLKFKKPTFTEKTLLVRIFEDLPPFEIKVDAYFEDWKRIIDWKTGDNVSMDDQLTLQGLTYKLGLEKEGYKVDKVVFADLTKGVEPPMPNVMSEFLYSKAKTMCDMILADRFPSKTSYLCNYCEYLLSCSLRYNCPFEAI